MKNVEELKEQRRLEHVEKVRKALEALGIHLDAKPQKVWITLDEIYAEYDPQAPKALPDDFWTS